MVVFPTPPGPVSMRRGDFPSTKARRCSRICRRRPMNNRRSGSCILPSPMSVVGRWNFRPSCWPGAVGSTNGPSLVRSKKTGNDHWAVGSPTTLPLPSLGLDWCHSPVDISCRAKPTARPMLSSPDANRLNNSVVNLDAALSCTDKRMPSTRSIPFSCKALVTLARDFALSSALALRHADKTIKLGR